MNAPYVDTLQKCDRTTILEITRLKRSLHLAGFVTHEIHQGVKRAFAVKPCDLANRVQVQDGWIRPDLAQMGGDGGFVLVAVRVHHREAITQPVGQALHQWLGPAAVAAPLHPDKHETWIQETSVVDALHFVSGNIKFCSVKTIEKVMCLDRMACPFSIHWTIVL